MHADAVGKECAGRAQYGTQALEQALTSAFDAVSLGIYNCREVRGGGALSVHAEGRALDLRPSDWSDARPSALGNQILGVLGSQADALGVQRVIWFGRVYDHASPLGRAYHGASPHHDHLHIEQTWAASQSLSYDHASDVIGVSLDLPEGDQVLCLRRFDDLEDGMRWLYVDGVRYRLHSWSTGPAALETAGVPTVALSDAQLRTIREV